MIELPERKAKRQGRDQRLSVDIEVIEESSSESDVRSVSKETEEEESGSKSTSSSECSVRLEPWRKRALKRMTNGDHKKIAAFWRN